nr:MAG TPA: hypothetical protein [Caudoviricetes sp.]
MFENRHGHGNTPRGLHGLRHGHRHAGRRHTGEPSRCAGYASRSDGTLAR